MSLRLRHLDLDGAIAAQPGVVARLKACGAAEIDATDLGPKLRLVAQGAARAALLERLMPWRRMRGPTLTFYGSGDFHHITADLIGLVEEDITLIHFDNHPDWVRFPSSINCGGWVNRALRLPQVRRIVSLGLDSADLDWPETKFANLEAMREGRLEVHALERRRTRILGRSVTAPGIENEGTRLVYTGLNAPSFEASIEKIAARLPDCPLYITIDKDVLGAGHALTNWEQGRMSLIQLQGALEVLAACRPIRAVDICGDWSAPRLNDLFRRVISCTDRASISPDPAAAARINGATNLRLLEQIEALTQARQAA